MQESNDKGASSGTLPEANSKESQASGDYTISVLLVDDQAMIGEAVRRLLLPETDINYHYCADPTNVFEVIKQVKPTVILQDLVMPDVNGLELLQKYRSNEATANIPIIVLSTREEPKVKSMAFKLGATDYLVKLPDVIELVARLRYHSKAYINQLQRDNALKELQNVRSSAGK